MLTTRDLGKSSLTGWHHSSSAAPRPATCPLRPVPFSNTTAQKRLPARPALKRRAHIDIQSLSSPSPVQNSPGPVHTVNAQLPATFTNFAQVGLAAGAAALSLLVAVSAPGPVSAQQAAPVVGPARVVDGDTLRVQDVKIRMFGIDAPEKSQTCKDAAGNDYNCGQVSLQALTQKLNNEVVQCNEVARDIYGRSVATCFVKQGSRLEDVNQWMVENGHAVAYRQYSKDYIPAEDAARGAKRGIWQGPFQMPADYRRAARQQGGGAPTRPDSAPDASTSSIDLGDLMATLFGAPAGCADPQIKGNISASGEKIYHVPGGRSYRAVKIEPEKGEKFYCTEAEAEKDGFRKSLI